MVKIAMFVLFLKILGILEPGAQEEFVNTNIEDIGDIQISASKYLLPRLAGDLMV